jgi:hypothetical protein
MYWEYYELLYAVTANKLKLFLLDFWSTKLRLLWGIDSNDFYKKPYIFSRIGPIISIQSHDFQLSLLDMRYYQITDWKQAWLAPPNM